MEAAKSSSSAKKGLAGTSVDEITERCGVSKGTFYTYFKRKEDVIFALSREAVHQEIYENAQAHEGTFLERLAFYSGEFFRRISKKAA